MAAVIALVLALPFLVIMGVQRSNQEGKYFYIIEIYKLLRLDVSFATLCWIKYSELNEEAIEENFNIEFNDIIPSYRKRIIYVISNRYKLKELKDIHQSTRKLFAPDIDTVVPRAAEAIRKESENFAIQILNKFDLDKVDEMSQQRLKQTQQLEK